MTRHPVGTVYLLHFDQAVSDHARHYLGWASDLAVRLEAHREGRGARLMEVVAEREFPRDLGIDLCARHKNQWGIHCSAAINPLNRHAAQIGGQGNRVRLR